MSSHSETYSLMWYALLGVTGGAISAVVRWQTSGSIRLTDSLTISQEVAIGVGAVIWILYWIGSNAFVTIEDPPVNDGPSPLKLRARSGVAMLILGLLVGSLIGHYFGVYGDVFGGGVFGTATGLWKSRDSGNKNPFEQ